MCQCVNVSMCQELRLSACFVFIISELKCLRRDVGFADVLLGPRAAVADTVLPRVRGAFTVLTIAFGLVC